MQVNNELSKGNIEGIPKVSKGGGRMTCKNQMGGERGLFERGGSSTIEERM